MLYDVPMMSTQYSMLVSAVHQTDPGEWLYRLVMAAFVLRGSSLNAWCRTNGVDRSHARLCLLGAWDGPKARGLRANIMNEIGCDGHAVN